MAAGSEIKGSRSTNVGGKLTEATQLFVTDDGTTGIPAIGADYTGDAAGIMARKCISVRTDPEYFPGIYFHVVTFRQFVAYA